MHRPMSSRGTPGPRLLPLALCSALLGVTFAACVVHIEPFEGLCDGGHPCGDGGACQLAACLAGDAGADGGDREDGGDGGVERDDDGGAGVWLSGTTIKEPDGGPFATWRRRPIEIVAAWADVNSATQEEVYILGPSGQWGDWEGPLDFAVGGIFKDEGETWRAAADGGQRYVVRWTQMLKNIQSYRQGKGTTYIRFAQEFNTAGMKWSVDQGEVEDFKKAWLVFCGLGRATFPEAKLVWNPNDTTTSDLGDARDAYPDDGCVDVIGLRSHNQPPHFISTAADFERLWEARLDGGAPVGPEAWRQFGLTKHVPMALSDWASVGIDGGGGDSPEYFTGMYRWLRQHGGSGSGEVRYEVYVQLKSRPELQLFPGGNQPEAAKKYQELW